MSSSFFAISDGPCLRWARLRFALLWVYWFSLFPCVGPVVGLSGVGLWNVGLTNVELSDVRFPVVRLLWKLVSAALGEVLDQAGHKSPTAPAPAPKKIYTGRVKRKHGT